MEVDTVTLTLDSDMLSADLVGLNPTNHGRSGLAIVWSQIYKLLLPVIPVIKRLLHTALLEKPTPQMIAWLHALVGLHDLGCIILIASDLFTLVLGLSMITLARVYDLGGGGGRLVITW